MDRQALFHQIQTKDSFLCIGLDTDPAKIPAHLQREADPVFAFNRQIIDATHTLCVAYKPNLAFYEALGPKGLESLQKTLEYIPPDLFTIADAKRGDIGNTAALYARAYFEQMPFDAITVAPYMGGDSVTPFLGFDSKWVILLALTSNTGSQDFQQLTLSDTGEALFQQVIKTSQQWATADEMMYVVGATQAERLEEIRRIVPDHFLLVPGVGAQGGSLEAVARYGMNRQCGLLVNAARSIIYAGQGEDFVDKAQQAARELQQEMAVCLDKYL